MEYSTMIISQLSILLVGMVVGCPKVLCLQVFIIFWQGGVLGLVVLLLNLHLPLGIHLDLWGQESWHGNKLEVGVSDQLASQPQEGLLKVVI